MRKKPNRRSAKRSKKQQARKPRHKITFQDDNDLLVAFLGEIGWHTRAIAQKCNITEGMVQYRLSKAGVSRKDYRNGVSDSSSIVINECQDVITNELREVLPPQFLGL
ncbi:MAG: hypothetical protein ACWGQW_15770 [bacterium]